MAMIPGLLLQSWGRKSLYPKTEGCLVGSGSECCKL